MEQMSLNFLQARYLLVFVGSIIFASSTPVTKAWPPWSGSKGSSLANRHPVRRIAAIINNRGHCIHCIMPHSCWPGSAPRELQRSIRRAGVTNLPRKGHIQRIQRPANNHPKSPSLASFGRISATMVPKAPNHGT